MIKRTKNHINEHIFINDKLYQNNNQILNPDKNKYNLDLLSKLNHGSIKLIDKIFSTKLDYNNTLDEDKLYDNNYLSSINKEKMNNNIFKLTKRNIGFPQNKKFLFLNSLNNVNNNRNKFLNHIETQNNQILNDNKFIKDEILLRKNKIKNDNNINMIYGYNNEEDLKNYKINANKINRIISLSNEHRLGRDLNINHNKNKKNNLRTFTSNQQDENDILYKESISKLNNTRSNKRKEDISFKELLYNKNNNYYQSMEHNKESFYLNTIENNSIVNKSNKYFDLNSNNKDNYIISLNKEQIYKSENNNKIKPLSLPKNYRKINDKFNFSKIIQNVMQEKDFSNKFLLKKKNKSNFNKIHMNYKTIEPYKVKNRNNTIDNNKIPINLTKRIKDINFEKKDHEFKTINDDLMKNIFLKNTKFEIKKKKNDIFTPMVMNDNFIPLLTENNRNRNSKIHN